MENAVTLIQSNLTSWTYPATWYSRWINIGQSNTLTTSFHIRWTDVSITWYLRRSHWNHSVAVGDYDDITAWYRLIDPAWVDPLKGDPLSQHIVAFQNVGAPYIQIGFSASDWTGGSRYLRLAFWRDTQFTRS